MTEDYNALFPLEPDTQRLTERNLRSLPRRCCVEIDEAYQEVEDRFRHRGNTPGRASRPSGVIDRLWVEHLTAMDELREGVQSAGLRAEKTAGRLQDRRFPHVRSIDRSHSPRYRHYDLRVDRQLPSNRCKPALLKRQPREKHVDEEARPQQVNRKKVSTNAPCRRQRQLSSAAMVASSLTPPDNDLTEIENSSMAIHAAVLLQKGELAPNSFCLRY